MSSAAPMMQPVLPLSRSNLLRSAEAKATVLIGFGFVLWLAVAALTQPGVPLDMAEMVAWGNQWQWGYHKHPPLPCWIAETIWSSTGSTLVAYAFSQLCTVVSLGCVFLVARRWLSVGHALIAVAALQASYYTHYTTLDLNHTITCRVFWSLAVLSFLRAVDSEPRASLERGPSNTSGFWQSIELRPLLWWSLCGIALGLGGLSKYYIAVLAGCFALVPCVVSKYRPLLKRVGPWWMVTLAALVVAPHVVWLINNEWMPLTYAMRRGSLGQSSVLGHVINPVEFVLKQAGVWLVLLLVLKFLLRPASDSQQNADDSVAAGSAPHVLSGADRVLMHLVLVGPILGFLFASAITGASLRSMWGGPLWTFFPVWVMMQGKWVITRSMQRRAFGTALGLCTVMATISASVNFMGPYFQSRPSRHHIPTHALAAAIESTWRTHGSGPLPIIAGPFFDASLVNMHHSDRPALYYDLRPELAPWTSDEELRRRGGVLVWALRARNEGDTPKLPSDWGKRFPNAIVDSVAEVPLLTDASLPPARYGIAVVPPREQLAAGGTSSSVRR